MEAMTAQLLGNFGGPTRYDMGQKIRKQAITFCIPKTTLKVLHLQLYCRQHDILL